MTFSRTLLACAIALLTLPASPAARDAKSAGGEGVPMAAPEDVGMSSARLERVSAAMQRYIDAEQVAGTVSLIARRGKVVHFEAQGWRDSENQEPMSKDVIFRIASMTKPITSVALMMLYEEGHFQLRDPVS